MMFEVVQKLSYGYRILSVHSSLEDAARAMSLLVDMGYDDVSVQDTPAEPPAEPQEVSK